MFVEKLESLIRDHANNTPVMVNQFHCCDTDDLFTEQFDLAWNVDSRLEGKGVGMGVWQGSARAPRVEGKVAEAVVRQQTIGAKVGIKGRAKKLRITL